MKVVEYYIVLNWQKQQRFQQKYLPYENRCRQKTEDWSLD
jgi:hypothetical protein